MKVVLLFPPLAEPSLPYLSLPSLTAVLRRAGHEVIQRDLNLEFFDELLTPASLSAADCACRETVAELSIKSKVLPRLKTLLLAQMGSDMLSSQIEAVKALLKGRIQANQIWDYERALRVVTAALSLLSTRYQSTTLRWSHLMMRYSSRDSQQILQALADRDENPFFDFYTRRVLPWLKEQRPALIGISVALPSQPIPAFTLAYLLREEYQAQEDRPFLIMGGSGITWGIEPLLQCTPLARLADAYCLYEGERSILALTEHLEGRRGLTAVPNLVFQQADGWQRTPLETIRTIDELPLPDFEGLDLNEYYSPKVVITLQTARECYWHRCAFCTVTFTNGAHRVYRPRPLSPLLDHLQALSRSRGVNFVHFVDAAIPPIRLRAIAQGLLTRGLEVQWSCYARFDPGFDARLCTLLRESGCVLIQFGLESAVQRILDRMDKGTSVRAIEETLENCHRAGLAVTLYVIVGFPGETQAEAEQTIRFVLDHRERIQYAYIAPFLLDRQSKVEKNPDLYGVCRMTASSDLFLNYDTYEVTSGLTQQQAQALHRRYQKVLARVFGDWVYGEPLYADLAKQRQSLPTCGLDEGSKPALRRGLHVLAWTPQATSPFRMIDSEGIRGGDAANLQPQETFIFDPETWSRAGLRGRAWDLLKACQGQETLAQIRHRLDKLSTSEFNEYLNTLTSLGILELG